MGKLKKGKPLKRFLSIYFSVFTVILVLVIGTGYYFLQDYQRNLPSEKGLEVIKAIETMDMQTLDAISSNLPLSLKDEKYFSQYLKFFGEEPDLFFYAGTSEVESQLVYLIANKDKTMATLTLQKTGKKSRFGFEEVRILDLVFKPVTSTKIVVQSPVEFMINETPFTPQIQEVQSSKITNFDPAIKEIEILTYSFKEFQFITSVTAPDHPDIEVNYDPVTSTYTVLSKINQATNKAITDFAEKAIQAHTRLWKLPTVTRSDFLYEFAYPKSKFENLVKLYDLTVKYDFISDSFTNFVIKDINQYGPNAFSANVSISYSVTSTFIGKVVTQVSHPACIFYFTNINGKWKITDMSLMVK